MPKVSIVVPVYNVEKYLDRCMVSLLNQTLKDIEIILVDDGSSDNCPLLCEKYAKKDERIKVVHKENAGLGLARNSGMKVATGEYIAFVDSDDCIALNTYEYCYLLAKREDLDVVRFQMDRFIDKVSVSSIKTEQIPIICRDSQTLRQQSLAFWGYIVTNNLPYIKNASSGSACGGIYNIVFLNKHNLLFKSEREYLSEDVEFVYNVLQKASAVGFTSFPFYHYFKNPQSLTTTVKIDKVDRAIVFSKQMTQEMLRDGYSEYEAEIHSMYYSLSILRDVQKLVFLSNLPFHVKKEWFHKQREKEYMKEIRERYPLSKMHFKYNVSFRLTMGGYFYLSYLLVKIKGR